eukprot:GHVO01020338.1.p1 GENE.GHVO01020338.1~~GHVO01020338.1.p1  ORF type:complete len:211 (+),score=33.97 GHVO01020338.1:28-660(+)
MIRCIVAESSHDALYPAGVTWRQTQGPQSSPAPADPLTQSLMEFRSLLDAQIKMVEKHFQSEHHYLLDRISSIESDMNDVHRQYNERGIHHSTEKALEAHLQRLQRALVAIWSIFEKLESYIQLNSIAVYKILKKRDKKLGVAEVHFELPHYKERLSKLKIDDNVKRNLLELYSRSCHVDETEIGVLLPACLVPSPQLIWTRSKHLCRRR